MCSSGAGVSSFSTLRPFLRLLLLPSVLLYFTTSTTTDSHARRARSIWPIAKRYFATWTRHTTSTFSAYERSTMDVTGSTTLLPTRRTRWINGWKHCVMCCICIWTVTVSCFHCCLSNWLKYCSENHLLLHLLYFIISGSVISNNPKSDIHSEP